MDFGEDGRPKSNDDIEIPKGFTITSLTAGPGLGSGGGSILFGPFKIPGSVVKATVR